jgi:superfamily II DNA or RNA helicase
MIQFHATNKTIQVASCPPELLLQLRAYLTVAVKDQYFAKRYAKHGWDGTARFINSTDTFSRGLWLQVKHWLVENNLTYEIQKTTSNIAVNLTDPIINKHLTLRPNQLDALNAWLKFNAFGIIWGPPNFGKTEVAAAAIATLRPTRVFFLVNSRDLLLQAKERFEQRLPDVKPGVIGDSGWELGERVTVAMVQTLYNILRPAKKIGKHQRPAHPRQAELKQILAATDFIICDEVHHARSAQIKLVMRYTRARYCLGLSARPFHEYDRDLQRMTAEDASILACLGPIVYKETPSDAIARGESAKPQLLLVPIYHPLINDVNWAMTRKLLFASYQLLNVVVHLTKAAAEAGQATLAIAANSLPFMRRLHKGLLEAGVNAVALHGGLDTGLRQDARLALNQDQIQAAVATTIYDEGVDIPNLRQLILAYGGKSLIKADQRVGRGLRKKVSGQNKVVIADFISYSPSEPRKDYLYKHSLIRIKRYLEEAEYDIFLIEPDQHSAYVRRLLKDRATPLDRLPDAAYYRSLAGTT